MEVEPCPDKINQLRVKVANGVAKPSATIIAARKVTSTVYEQNALCF